jgi:D-inositol-3-phosphate glycosyltransferase
MHTSPLAQPGAADAGGMNVYVRELVTALARSGVRCEVFTRQEHEDQPRSLWVEPGFRAHHVAAGPIAPVDKELLPDLVEKWTAGVARHLSELSARGDGVDLIHANYWLSAVAGHALKHSLALPLMSTFHTLERVKAEAGESEPDPSGRRAAGEVAAMGCSDAVLASSSIEAEQLVALYDADPGRIEMVPPGVDRAFFSPGDQAQARRALGLPTSAPLVLFVGRIQPLKGLVTAVSALARLVGGGGQAAAAELVVIGGPSGPRGHEELARAEEVVKHHGLGDRVHMVKPQPHELLSTYYRAADACIVPSRSESFGLVALEAAACGTPVVASAVGGLTHLVDHGRTGYLVGADDVDGFAHYLGELLADRSLARLLGAAANERSASYTWASAAAQVATLCQSLTGRELVSCS